MKSNKFSEEQIIGILRQAESGVKVTDICRQNGISDKTFYRWRSKYAGLEVADVKRLHSLEEENSKLKKLVADLMLDNTMLKDVLSKNF